MYIMILSIMYYFTNFGDLCDSGSFHLYGFPGSTTHYDKKFILLLLTSFISEIKLFLFLFLAALNLIPHFEPQFSSKFSEPKFSSKFLRLMSRLVPTLQYFGTLICDRLHGIMKLYNNKS